MTHEPIAPTSALPEVFLHRGGRLLRELSQKLDDAWLDAADDWPPVTRYSEIDPLALSELAESFGWGFLLNSVGGVMHAARSELLADLPRQEQSIPNRVAFWAKCLFDLELRSFVVDRQATDVHKFNTPRIHFWFTCAGAEPSTDGLRSVCQQLIPACSSLGEVTVEAQQQSNASGTGDTVHPKEDSNDGYA